MKYIFFCKLFVAYYTERAKSPLTLCSCGYTLVNCYSMVTRIEFLKSGKCHFIPTLPVAQTNPQVEPPKTMWALRVVIRPCGAAATGLDGVKHTKRTTTKDTTSTMTRTTEEINARLVLRFAESVYSIVNRYQNKSRNK